MTREYFVRGQRKTVEEIDNVVAVKVTPDERGEPSVAARTLRDRGARRRGGRAGGHAGGVREGAVAVRRALAETARALDAREAVPDAEDAGKLVRRPNGRFGIVTRRLNVQLRPDIPAEEAEQILAERGLRRPDPAALRPQPLRGRHDSSTTTRWRRRSTSRRSALHAGRAELHRARAGASDADRSPLRRTMAMGQHRSERRHGRRRRQRRGGVGPDARRRHPRGRHRQRVQRRPRGPRGRRRRGVGLLPAERWQSGDLRPGHRRDARQQPRHVLRRHGRRAAQQRRAAAAVRRPNAS